MSKFNPCYYVYIVECVDKTFYTGSTDNLDIRINEHNGEGPKKGARYTSGRRPVLLKYFEEYETRGQALKREKQIQKMTHWQKELTIRNRSPYSSDDI
jgi:putative endonuclease